MPVSRNAISQLALALTLGAAVTNVWAQAVPTPGAIQDQLRRPPAMPPAAQPATPFVAPTPAHGVPAGGRKILIHGFDIIGSSAISPAELQTVVAPYAGKELTLQEIYDVADQVTRYYREHGYTLASAIVPEQKVSSGQIQLQVIEGRLGKITVEGNQHYRSNFILWQLNDLQPGEVVTSAPLEHEILMLNDLPGLDARAVMQPGADFGTSDLVVQTQETPLEGDLQVNNYGRESLGQYQIQADAALNGLLGIGDRFDFSGLYASADLLHYGRAAYSMPVSPWGTRASVYYSGYDYHVNAKTLGASVAALDINGDGQNFGVNFLHPVWRAPRKNLFIGVGYDRTVTSQTESTLNTLSSANLSLAQFTALFNYQAPDQSFSTVGATLSTNFQGSPLVLDAAGGLVPENNTEAAKLQVDLSHFRDVWQKLGLLTRFTGVVSADPLVDLDQFRLGGPTSVRAYPTSEVGGDQGFFASAELQHPVSFLPALASQRVKAFIDTGTVYRKKSEVRGVRAEDSLSGAGVGWSATALGRVAVDLLLAHPIGQHQTSDQNEGLRVWFSVNAQY